MEYDIYEIARTALFATTFCTFLAAVPVTPTAFVFMCMVNFSYFQDMNAEQQAHDATSDSTEIVIEVD